VESSATHLEQLIVHAYDRVEKVGDQEVAYRACQQKPVLLEPFLYHQSESSSGGMPYQRYHILRNPLWRYLRRHMLVHTFSVYHNLLHPDRGLGIRSRPLI
jgi:hypothetical protein